MLEFLHFLGACLFIGNIMVSAFWKVLADRTREVGTMRFACRLVNLTDLVFTGGGATLLLVTGHLMAASHGGVLATGWMLGSYLLFAISGALWVTVLVPIQIKQSRLLKDEPLAPAKLQPYFRLSRIWSAVGALATAIPLPAIYLMSAKPW